MSETPHNNESLSTKPAEARGRSRRLFRTLLVILSVVVIVPSGVYIYRCHRQYNLAIQLRNDVSDVYSHEEYPEWMRNLLGDYMLGVMQLDTYESDGGATAEMLSILAQLEISEVSLADPEFTPQAARKLARTKSLRSLEITSHIVIDAAVGNPLSPEEFKILTYRVSGQTLKELVQSESLHSLAVRNSLLPGDVIEILSNARSLQSISLDEVEVPGIDFSSLSQLSSLTRLSVGGDFLTKENFQQIGILTQMKELYLRSPEMNDSWIQPLSRLKNLKELEIEHLNLTDEAIEQLRDALPECDVIATELAE